MAIDIREHVPGEDLDDFLNAARKVFADDPAWIAPLEFDLRGRLTPASNPFFERGDAALFTAWRDGELVGRISASIDHEHLRIHDDGAGFFGFFDTVDDQEVANALLDRAAAWLGRRGMTTMRGPYSLYQYEELGLLVKGHEHPPAVMMAHSRVWQERLATEAGLAKVKDLYAWRFQIGTMSKRAIRAWEQVKAMPEVELRSVRINALHEELAIIMEIFNDAWSENWGFIPSTPAEVKKSGEDLRLIVNPELAFIAEVHGKPVGMVICLPNVNEVIADFDGKLNPITVAKLLYRLKVKRPKSGRLMMLGISRELRGVRRYAALSHALYVEVAKRGERIGLEWGELSWTLEDNAPINLGIRSTGAEIYKVYRLFERPIG